MKFFGKFTSHLIFLGRRNWNFKSKTQSEIFYLSLLLGDGILKVGFFGIKSCVRGRGSRQLVKILDPKFLTIFSGRKTTIFLRFVQNGHLFAGLGTRFSETGGQKKSRPGSFFRYFRWSRDNRIPNSQENTQLEKKIRDAPPMKQKMTTQN